MNETQQVINFLLAACEEKNKTIAQLQDRIRQLTAVPGTGTVVPQPGIQVQAKDLPSETSTT